MRVMRVTAILLALTFSAITACAQPIVAWGEFASGPLSLPGNFTNVVTLATSTGSDSGGSGLAIIALESNGAVATNGTAITGSTTPPSTINGAIGVGTSGGYYLALNGTGVTTTWPTNSPAANIIGVSSVSLHDGYGIALKNDGTVTTWGTTIQTNKSIPTLSGIVAVAAGGGSGNDHHFLALKNDGTVVAWGSNDANDCAVPTGLGNVVAIAAGQVHNLALKSDGTVVAWGDDTFRECDVPANLTGVVAIAAGPFQSLALKNDGTVVEWGGASATDGEVPAGLSGVVAISACFKQNFAVKASVAPIIAVQPMSLTVASGKTALLVVQADGANTYQWYQGNSGDTSNPISGANTPGLVLPNVTTGGNYWVRAGNGISTVDSATASVSVNANIPRITLPPSNANAVVDGGSAFSVSASGNASTTYQWQLLTPGNSGNAAYYIWSNISNNLTYSGATTSNLVVATINSSMNGTAYRCVVANAAGSDISRVATLAVYDSDPFITTQTVIPNLISTNDLIVQCLAVGSNAQFTVSAVSISDPLPQFQWQRLPAGTTSWLNLSDNAGFSGTSTNTLIASNLTLAMQGDQYQCVISDSAGSATSLPLTLNVSYVTSWGYNYDEECEVPANLTNDVVAVSAGADHSLALKSDGTVVAWNSNSSYLGNSWQSTVPPGLSNVVAISAGSYHSLALQSDGNIVYWGGGFYQGEGYTIPGFSGNAVAISAGGESDLAILDDGTVFGWGADSYGELDIPANLNQVVAITAGDLHSLALKRDGTVVAWGDDTYGECDVPSGLSNVVAIASGEYFSLALKSDGTVVAWGDNFIGECSVPVGLTNVVAISAGGSHSLALKNDGTVVAWGDNDAYESNIPPGLHNVAAISCGSGFNTVLVSPALPQLQAEPANQVVGTGGVLQVTHYAGATYQWYEGQSGDTTHPVTGAVSPWLAPASTGSYWVKITTSQATSNSTAALATAAPETYAEWAAAQGLTGSLADPATVFPGAVVPNLVRFAMNLGSNPSIQQLPAYSFSNGFLTFNYQAWKGLSGYSLNPQVSTDLINWSNIPSYQLLQDSDADPNTSRWEGTTEIPNSGPFFLRWQVTPSP